jgi:alpha-glucosidase
MSEPGQPSSPWWHGAAIYQIYPRSFQDSSGNGVGDLRGITQKLSYVRDLGVDAVWLSPFFTSPMKDFGYDVSNYRDVDPLFGTLADADALLKEADRLGLKVIIDQVYSHTSDQHEWFKESAADRTNPKADWYVWADAKPDGSAPNNWMSIFGGPSWTWSSARGQYYLHNFLSSQPDLNLHNEEVQEEVLDTAKFWLERGVRGFRLDALHCSMHDRRLLDNPPRPLDDREVTRPYDLQWHEHDHAQPEMFPFLERFRSLTDEYEGVFCVAEVGADHALEVMRDYTAKSRLHSAYSFDFLWSPVLTADLVRQTVEPWLDSDGESQWPSFAFSNHDAVRVASRWEMPLGTEERAKLFALLLISLRGNIFIYQGEELGLPQADIPFDRLQDPEAIANWPKSLGRDGARTPLPWTPQQNYAGFSDAEPWLPMDPSHLELTVRQQEEDPSSTLSWFKNLLRIRQRYAALRTGSMRFLCGAGDLLLNERQGAGETFLAAFNLSGQPQEIDLPNGEVLASTTPSLLSLGSATLAPWSGAIIKKEAD